MPYLWKPWMWRRQVRSAGRQMWIEGTALKVWSAGSATCHTAEIASADCAGDTAYRFTALLPTLGPTTQ